MPLVLLGLLEIGLRIGGYGYPTSFFKRVQIGGEECLVDNDRFGLRFFPPELARIPSPVVMRANKAPGTFRIFVLGESAALGDPRPNFGASRYLEALLRLKYPVTKFEVVNVSMTAINSHAILPIGGKCARHDGDLWIVYMGNNEMVGPFGAASVLGPPPPPLWLARLQVAFQRAKVGQLAVALGRRLRGAPGGHGSWGGMEMFLKSAVPPGDPRKERAYRNFEGNLADILETAADAGVPVVLNTVAVNLKDCPPFASTPASDASAVAQALSTGLAAEHGQQWPLASNTYTRALEAHPESAELHFRLAEVCRQAGANNAAHHHYQAALDDDTLPFRADARINDLISRAAAKQARPGLAFCDAAKEMASAAPQGLLGEESFYEHVHFNFDGNYRLACLWAAEVAKLLPADVTRSARAGEPTRTECERLLGLTDWNRKSVVEEIVGRLGHPPFTGQFDHARRVDGFKAWVAQLETRMSNTPPAEARAVYEEALKSAPEDFRLHENFAEFLLATGDLPAATVEREKVCALIPHYFFAHFSLGVVLKDRGRLDDALAAFERAAALYPRDAEVWLQMGMVLGRQKQWQRAAACFARARELDAGDPRACLYEAEVLWKLEQRAASLAMLRDALRLKPDYWEAHFRLGDELAQSGDLAAAVTEFQEVVRLNPAYLKGQENLAMVLANLGRVEEAQRLFQEVLRRDPQNRRALDFLRRGQRTQSPGTTPENR